MSERKFDFLRTKPKDREFHFARIMFCVRNSKIEVAPKETTNSHLEWFEEEKWITEENIEEFLNQNIRGFYLPAQNSLYCYRGLGFWFDDDVVMMIRDKLVELKKTLDLKNDTRIFFGPKDSPIDGIKYPQWYGGMLKELKRLKKQCGNCKSWNIYKIRKEKEMSYTCEDAKKDIDFFFSGERSPEKEEALNRALYRHMTVGSSLKKHNISCQHCWNYYQKMKRERCGG